MKYAFFDTKSYDIPSFQKYGNEKGIEFKFFEAKLNRDTASLAAGCDGVCVFVNDTVDAAVIDKLHEMGVKAVALRYAGFNNVDMKYAYGKIHVFHGAFPLRHGGTDQQTVRHAFGGRCRHAAAGKPRVNLYLHAGFSPIHFTSSSTASR